MRKNGEKLNEAPRITLSTIHGAKGGEAENVVAHRPKFKYNEIIRTKPR